MDISFDKLIKLQKIDSEIISVNAHLDSIPDQIEAIDEDIKATAVLVSGARDKLAANQKKRRELEGEVKGIREQTAKFKRQLNDVKTNKEYSALLKEIEETDQKIARIEEEIDAVGLAERAAASVRVIRAKNGAVEEAASTSDDT